MSSNQKENVDSQAAEVAVHGPSTMAVSAAPARSEFELPISVELTAVDPEYRLDLRNDATFLGFFTLFESVRLESMVVSSVMLAGATRGLLLAFTGNAVKPVRFLSQPIAAYSPGAAYLAVTHDFVLPPSHPFGRELKTVNLGNPAPILHVSYSGGSTGATTVDVKLRIKVRVSVGGVGLVSGPAFSGFH
jgi:hypothetical protein